VSAPVIACPPPSDAFGGADVFSSLRMPSGVVPAVILDAENAALLAAKIFGVTDPTIRARVSDVQRQNADKLLHDDAELNPTAVQG
jgi:5-(carboxyamino)imidazole ribonucleotide mutase